MEKRLMTKREAAAYLALPPRRFAATVASGQLPRPVLRGRWDREALDRAIDAMSGATSRRDADIEQRYRDWQAEHEPA